MKISYYELLGMVKEGNAPERIEVSLTSGTTEIYKAEYDAGEFNYYLLQRDLPNENYRFYLSECFLESSMFDKCITILDKEKELLKIDLEKLEDEFRNNNFTAKDGIVFISYYINQAIDEINKLKELEK